MEQAADINPQPQPRSVSILGSTGSIGKSTIDLLMGHREKFRVRALTANKNVALLAEQARALQSEVAVVADEASYLALKAALSGTGIRVAAGSEAVLEAASHPADWVMAAIVGSAGVEATLAAIRQGRTVALANKEALVCAGPFMMDAVAKSGATLLPVDSEHNAVFQVFDPVRREGIRRIILTASGGPFLRRSRESLHDVTPAEAIRHPNWSMGAKISVDSATMMNKSLEIIEASYLFNLPSEQIDVMIHPQSLVHSMVEYIDGSILSQMGAPDMRTPIAHTLAWPARLRTMGDRLDLTQKMSFEFEPIDTERFYAVNIARNALKAGIGYPTVLNAANEVAVDAFLRGVIRFTAIENVSDKVLQTIKIKAISGITDIFSLDAEARAIAAAVIQAVK
ncbi:MAG TPA: 1-deoxy-D-xylulose-5-phosphate reductoisomerase [Patescibacteria group bacterium]|nr:1-deoxy-D-xylulose-5-phosphate reductoisomerase [Patescibacteria group bacterium]